MVTLATLDGIVDVLCPLTGAVPLGEMTVVVMRSICANSKNASAQVRHPVNGYRSPCVHLNPRGRLPNLRRSRGLCPPLRRPVTVEGEKYANLESDVPAATFLSPECSRK